MSKIFQQQSTLLNNTLSQLDNFYQPIGSKVNVYKFRKCSGSVYLTRYGELPIITKSENFQQNFQIYTGKEPITVVWDKSFHATGNKETNQIIKKYSVGSYETCYLSNAITISNETTSKNLYGKDYTTTFLRYDITLQSTTWLPSEDDIRDYVYLIFDKKAQSYKWLEIASITPVYNEETNNLQYCEINFESINDKYTQTGKSIVDFIQMGAIGEGYSFPKETHLANGDIQVDYDVKYLDDLGCNTLQLDFTSGTALSSVFVLGRRKSKKIGDGEYEVDAPHLLWLYDTQPPLISQFFYNQPNLNSYIASKWEPTKEGIWKSYKQAYRGNDRIGEYNILNTKEVITGLRHNQSSVRATNSNINTYTNWNKNRNFNINFDNQLAYDTNPYCIAEPYLHKQCNYIDFLNINSLINFASDVFDYDYKETKKWKLTDTLGILGSIVNVVVGGLDIGWTTSNILSQVPNDLNLIVPCISYEDGMLALDNTAPLPLDVFYDDKSQKVLPTSTNVLTCFRFRLTDRVIDISQVREGAPLGQGGNGVWDLKYVGQKKFENGEFINNDKTPFRLKLSTTTAAAPTDSDFEFIVDYLDFKAIGSCDYRVSAYDNANNPVYYSISETNAKARGDIRIWGNTTKFNYYENFNTSGEVNYPDYDNPPPPSSDLVGFDLGFDSNLGKLFKQPAIFNRWVLKEGDPIVREYPLKTELFSNILPFNKLHLVVGGRDYSNWISGSFSRSYSQETIYSNDINIYDINFSNEELSKKSDIIFKQSDIDWEKVKTIEISIAGEKRFLEFKNQETETIFLEQKLLKDFYLPFETMRSSNIKVGIGGAHFGGGSRPAKPYYLANNDFPSYNMYFQKYFSGYRIKIKVFDGFLGFKLSILPLCDTPKLIIEKISLSSSALNSRGNVNVLKEYQNDSWDKNVIDYVKVYY